MPEWIGKIIGKVRIDQLLAHGGMAEVYLGTHLTLDRPVAIKVLHSYVEDDPDLRERLQREARVVAGFRHPNIVQVYDFDTIEGHPYIVMEYLKGPTLAVYLRSLNARGQRLTFGQVASLLHGPAAALDYAHGSGVIHRDVKPGNIMLHGEPDESPNGPRIADLDSVVTDFGLLRVAGASHQTSVGTIAGTPNYMSPEQASGTPVDYRTDIYSLGVVLYEMLAGRAPFDGDSTLTVIYKQINETPPPISGVTAVVQAVIDRALLKNPDDRYQSCAEMAAAFEAAIAVPTLAGETAQAPGSETIAPVADPELISGTPSNATIGMSQTSAAPATRSTRRRIGRAVSFAAAGISMAALVAGAFLILPKLNSSASGTSETPPPTNTSGALPVTGDGGAPSSAGMTRIPAGTYQVGVNAPDDFHAAQQAVSLAEFWIDSNLVTNDEYKSFLQASGSQAPQVWPGNPKHPVRGVTWDQANAYCASLKKRLPTEAEWEASGRGPAEGPQLFPWGNDPTAAGSVLQMPDLDTYEVGSLAFNKSPLGVYDLVGDVWQWVGEAYASVQGGYKVLRGGRFGLPQDLAYRITVAPDDNRYVKFTGFRCAADHTK